MLPTFKTTLSEKKELAKDIFLFRFQLVEPKEIAFKAGQYLMLKVPNNDSGRARSSLARMTYFSRLYSIASPDFQKDSFELLVQIIPGGAASTYLSNLKIGTEVIFQGPAGLFTLRETNRDKIFLATGTGIAPVRSMIKSILNFKFKILNLSLFWGLRHFSDVYFLEEFKSAFAKASADKQFNFKICLSREPNLKMIAREDKKYFALGHITDGLDKLISNFDFYLCGSREVVESLRQYLEQKGAPKEQVFFEKF